MILRYHFFASSIYLSVCLAVTTYANSTVFQDSIALSTSTIRYPAFIRPSVNPLPQCDIWGPLCQTGSIVVAVNLTSTTTTTTVACSSYLSAQSASASEFADFNHGVNDAQYQSSLGRSPQCTAWVDNMESFSNCPNNASGILSQSSVYKPFGVVDYGLGGALDYYYCCGECTLHIDQARVFYFPEGNGCTNSNETTATLAMTSKASLQPVGSTAIVSGYTFTSPSIYVQVVGTVSVADFCGPVGPVRSSIMISLPSGGLSTASFDIPVGSMFYNPNTRALSPSQGVTQAINVTDFACPTWGLGTPFLSLLTGSTTTYTYTRTMVTSPFNPIIVPPSQLLGLDPAWRSQCTGFYSYGEQLLQYDIYDPPFRLTPGGGLDPSTTPLPTPAPVSATMTSSWPSSLSTTAVPVPGSPSVFSPKTAVSISSVSHTSAASHTQNQPDTVSEISTGSSAPDPLDNPTTGQPLPSVSSLSSATAAPFISNLTFASTEGITNSETSQGIQSLQSTQKLGGIIFSAFEGGDVSTIDVQSSNGAIVTAGTQSVNVINPSAVVVNGATYTAGGPPATLSGGLISIAPIINTQLSVQTITAGGASSSAFDSTTSVAGKPGITYSGTVSSLSTGAGNGSASVKPFEGAQVKVEVSRDSRSLLGLGAWLIWAYWY